MTNNNEIYKKSKLSKNIVSETMVYLTNGRFDEAYNCLSKLTEDPLLEGTYEALKFQFEKYIASAYGIYVTASPFEKKEALSNIENLPKEVSKDFSVCEMIKLLNSIKGPSPTGKSLEGKFGKTN